MRIAVIADVHANLPALEAALHAASYLSVDRTLCLGDLVGYGGEPVETVARLRRGVVTIVAGNHDLAAAGAAPSAGTSPVARRALEWTRSVLGPADVAFLRTLPVIVRDPALGLTAVHGCFLREDAYASGYVTATMIEPNLDALPMLGMRIGLCGHTHVPLVAWRSPRGVEERRYPEVVAWPRDATSVIVNPGSVGQPRDGDRRASFAVVDLRERTVALHRVAYDVGRAARAIVAAGLPVELAERLFEGR